METMDKKERKAVKFQTPYQLIAAKYHTTELYVGQIARGERIPKRGKGLEILNEINELSKKLS
ncbi:MULTISPECIES: XRE family transcriptional regulator [Chryseobacterium]|uniref:XRE family transcriptional regulator n=1 Tax=Candidatus Chryseobacterium massiliense TaxID=204089 RepID=A0A3D9B2H6_9FLAO|nr:MULTISPECIES: XRE family transcriptional regulator [Chryseobacterium]REC47844.1 XRE family transcriptional regulator [Candidatus Chryseobacterium massiliae]